MTTAREVLERALENAPTRMLLLNYIREALALLDGERKTLEEWAEELAEELGDTEVQIGRHFFDTYGLIRRIIEARKEVEDE